MSPTSTGILEAPLTTVERFASNIEVTDKCWEWTGGKKLKGYGQFYININGIESNRSSHRIMYELTRGVELTYNGYVIDHLCRNTSCVNPVHLELVTNAENIYRGVNHVAKYANRNHCDKGHEYTPENTSYHKRDGKVVGRRCKTCHNSYMCKRRKTPKGKEEHNRLARDYRAKQRLERR